MNREMLYNDLSGFLAMHFPCKVQKISINAGFTCPNRDGSVGYGGCTYFVTSVGKRFEIEYDKVFSL